MATVLKRISLSWLCLCKDSFAGIHTYLAGNFTLEVNSVQSGMEAALLSVASVVIFTLLVGKKENLDLKKKKQKKTNI